MNWRCTDLHRQQYQTLQEAAGAVRLTEWSTLTLNGPEATSFFHQLSTNKIHSLQPHEGCECFVTSVQGRILSHGIAAVGTESVHYFTHHQQIESLLTHLEKYHIAERVEILDSSTSGTLWFLTGPTLARQLEGLGELPPRMYEHRTWEVNQQPLLVVRIPLIAHEGYLLWAANTSEEKTETAEAIAQLLTEHGVALCSEEALEMARLESGFPLYGLDLTEANLPQEVNRTEHAISFDKGCYLGQETVARIDALGHVNRLLVGLSIPTEVAVEQGTPVIDSQGKEVGQITSIAYSPQLDHGLAMGYVKRELATPEATLQVNGATAKVVAFPVSHDKA